MGNPTVWALILVAGLLSGATAETRQIQVSVTPHAAAARADAATPYVLRIDGLRLPGDRSSRLTIFGEAPSKGSPVLGTAEGMGWRGGPKLAPPHNFVIPLSPEARRYFTGRERARFWVHLEGTTELRFEKAVVDVSESR